MKNYHISFKEGISDEEIEKLSTEIVEMLTRDTTINGLDDIKRIDGEKFFTEFDFISDESISFVDETRRVSAQSLLDSILMTPDIWLFVK